MTAPIPPVSGGTAGAKDGPLSKGLREQMTAAGVESVSELHALYGKTVTIGTYRWINRQGSHEEAAGGPAKIFYAVGDSFHARMANGREPSGAISGIVTAADGSLSYEFPEGA